MLRSALVARLAFIAQQSRWLARSNPLFQLLHFQLDIFSFVHTFTSSLVIQASLVSRGSSTTSTLSDYFGFSLGLLLPGAGEGCASDWRNVMDASSAFQGSRLRDQMRP